MAFGMREAQSVLVAVAPTVVHAPTAAFFVQMLQFALRTYVRT
jgi:hypothetical protein